MKMGRSFFIVLFLAVLLSGESQFRYRKYEHVKNFYAPLAKDVLEYGLKYNIPPAAILAIAGIESGYGRGYVAKITGNIMSLGANKGEKQLPALTLPSPKKQPWIVLYNPKEIAKYKKEELVYIKHPPSLKKDYRPAPYAGTWKHLAYFDNHPKERKKANIECIFDFCTKWITQTNRHKPFREARYKMDSLVKRYGKKVLLQRKTAITFIMTIGGKKDSFNYRASWPKKVISIMDKVGIVEHCIQMQMQNNSCHEAWQRKH